MDFNTAPRMDLKQLNYFVRVAELGSFTRASIALDIAQPALSRQVRLLEVELRQPLLLRNGRGVTLTDAGHLLLARGRDLLSQFAHLTEDLACMNGSPSGRVALGLPPSLARRLAAPLARVCAERMPNVAVSITEALSLTMKEALLLGRLDLALLYDLAPEPDVEGELLLEEPLCMVTAAHKRHAAHTGRPHRGAPISLAQLAMQPLVMPSRPNATRMVLERRLAALGLQPRIALEVNGVDTILELVAKNAGIAILPASAIIQTALPGNFIIHPISHPGLHICIYAATRAQRRMTHAQRAVLALIREQLGIDKHAPAPPL